MKYTVLLSLLRDVRKQSQLSQEELSLKLQKDHNFVTKYETGRRRIEINEFTQIAVALGKDPKILYGEYIDRLEKAEASKQSFINFVENEINHS